MGLGLGASGLGFGGFGFRGFRFSVPGFGFRRHSVVLGLNNSRPSKEP